MARQPKQVEATETDTAPEAQPEPQARAKAKPKTVRVVAKYPPFVDLIRDVRIGEEPVEVELHPWLEAQIEIGLVIVC